MWLRGVKGCMVCGRDDHRANQVHSKEQVQEAVRRLKEKQQMVMLTEEDLSYITEMFENDSDNEHDEQPHSDDESDEIDATYFVCNE